MSEVFTSLELAVLKLVERVNDLQAENTDLRQEIQQLKQDLEELNKENQTNNLLIERFERDRLEIRSRVERVIRQVATLDDSARNEGSIQ